MSERCEIERITTSRSLQTGSALCQTGRGDDGRTRSCALPCIGSAPVAGGVSMSRLPPDPSTRPVPHRRNSVEKPVANPWIFRGMNGATHSSRSAFAVDCGELRCVARHCGSAAFRHTALHATIRVASSSLPVVAHHGCGALITPRRTTARVCFTQLGPSHDSNTGKVRASGCSGAGWSPLWQGSFRLHAAVSNRQLY